MDIEDLWVVNGDEDDAGSFRTYLGYRYYRQGL